MKHLSNVTLIAYDNIDDPTRSLLALRRCTALFQFAAVVLVCRCAPMNANGEMIRVVNERGYRAAMQWEVTGIAQHVQTDFALCIHHDSCIANPDRWNDEWLRFDFIGAPWPKEMVRHDYPFNRVGNTGFCLKSKAFMRHSVEIGKRFDSRGPGDVFVCRTQRRRFERLGMKYAPLDVAAAFAWECNIEEYPDGRPDAFGRHKFNLPV